MKDKIIMIAEYMGYEYKPDADNANEGYFYNSENDEGLGDRTEFEELDYLRFISILHPVVLKVYNEVVRLLRTNQLGYQMTLTAIGVKEAIERDSLLPMPKNGEYKVLLDDVCEGIDFLKRWEIMKPTTTE